MKTWRWVVFFLGAGLIGAAACKKSSTVDDDDTTTTTHTGTGSGTTTTTATGSGTTSTGTGTGSTCDVDLAAEVGASAECSTCMAENCCAEAQAWMDTQDSAATQAAIDCGDAAGCADAQGQRYCVTVWCTTDAGMAFWQAMMDCHNTNCCTQFDAMEASAVNMDHCFVDPMPADCCAAGSAYVTWEGCMNTNCAGTGWPEGGFCAGG